MVLNLMLGYLLLEKLIDLMSDFKALIEYSIFGSSNNLFLFWSHISISVLVLNIIVTELIFLVIFTSPSGKTMDFSFIVERSSFNSFSRVGELKSFWSIIS